MHRHRIRKRAITIKNQSLVRSARKCGVVSHGKFSSLFGWFATNGRRVLGFVPKGVGPSPVMLFVRDFTCPPKESPLGTKPGSKLIHRLANGTRVNKLWGSRAGVFYRDRHQSNRGTAGAASPSFNLIMPRREQPRIADHDAGKSASGRR